MVAQSLKYSVVFLNRARKASILDAYEDLILAHVIIESVTRDVLIVTRHKAESKSAFNCHV